VYERYEPTDRIFVDREEYLEWMEEALQRCEEKSVALHLRGICTKPSFQYSICFLLFCTQMLVSNHSVHALRADLLFQQPVNFVYFSLQR
jgi:hypothetical protein